MIYKTHKLHWRDLTKSNPQSILHNIIIATQKQKQNKK